MAGYNRIGSLKVAMQDFVMKMRPDDHVALVTFNHNAILDVPL